MTCQFLRVFMVAVLFAAGSLNGALACHGAYGVDAEAHAAAHDGVSGTPGDGRASLHASDKDVPHAVHAAEHHGEHRDGPSGLAAGCEGCPHMHAHCCASAAMPAGDCGLKLTLALGMPALEAGAPLPLGQLFYPLLRPPSAAV